MNLPETNCKGCEARDRLNAILSARIDKLEAERDYDVPLKFGDREVSNSGFVWPPDMTRRLRRK